MKIYAFADEASPIMDKQIEAMLRNDLCGLEIRGVDGESIADITLEKAREVHQKMKNANLSVWSIGSPIGKIHIENDDFEAHLEKFKNTLEVAHILEAKNIRLFSFFLPKEKDPAIYRDEVFRRLTRFTEIAKGSGIDLCHENEKGIYGDNAARCLDILQNIPDLKGIFDPANFIQSGQDTMEAWKALSLYTKYLHIKDALKDGSVVPAGKGIGNLKFILDAYRAQGGNEVTIEPHLTIFEGLKGLEQEGDQTVIDAFRYPDADTAFDVACSTFKTLL